MSYQTEKTAMGELMDSIDIEYKELKEQVEKFSNGTKVSSTRARNSALALINNLKYLRKQIMNVKKEM